MLSTKDDSSVEDSASSVGDSTWDLIDDGSFAASDDECHRLSPQQTPVSDRQGGEVDVLDQSGILSAPAACSEDKIPAGILCSQADYATTVEVGATSDEIPWAEIQKQQDYEAQEGQSTVVHQTDTSQTSDVIRFDEIAIDDSISDDDGISTSTFAVLESFEGSRLHRISNALSINRGDCEVIGTLRQTMASRLCQPYGPYRLLYVGADAFKGPIVQKVSSALVSHLRPSSKSNRSLSSTFSIIPVSAFGSPASPEVVLVNSSGLQICVEHCTSAQLGKQKGEDALYVSLENSDNLCSAGPGPFEITPSSYVLPDLAIIYIEERETSPAKHIRLLAHSFIKRHCIPYILISPHKSWIENPSYGTVDVRLPHLCVEARSSSLSEPQVLARSPVDLASFLSIDAIHMSRSLAHVHRPKNSAAWEAKRASVDTQNPHSRLHKLGQLAEEVRSCTLPDVLLLSGSKLLFFMGIILCSILLSLSLLPAATQMQRFPLTMDSSRLNLARVPLCTKTTAFPSIIFSPLAPEYSTAIPHPGTKEALPTQLPDFSPSIFESALIHNTKLEGFVVYITGEYYIVLQPPQWLNILRKSPALAFTVFRGNDNLSFTHAVSVNGTHTLKLDQNEARGMLNVTVWTTRKPLLKESFMIEFGVPRLKRLTWRTASRNIVRLGQASFDSTRIKFQPLLAPTRSGARALAQQTMRFRDRFTDELGLWLSDSTSNIRKSIQAKWRESCNGLLKSPVSHVRPIFTFMLSQEQASRSFDSLMNSTSSLLTQWTRGTVHGVRIWSMFDIVGSVRQYREIHFIESQTLAARLWWRVRGGLSLRAGQFGSSLSKQKDNTGRQS